MAVTSSRPVSWRILPGRTSQFDDGITRPVGTSTDAGANAPSRASPSPINVAPEVTRDAGQEKQPNVVTVDRPIHSGCVLALVRAC